MKLHTAFLYLILMGCSTSGESITDRDQAPFMVNSSIEIIAEHYIWEAKLKNTSSDNYCLANPRDLNYDYSPFLTVLDSDGKKIPYVGIIPNTEKYKTRFELFYPGLEIVISADLTKNFKIENSNFRTSTFILYEKCENLYKIIKHNAIDDFMNYKLIHIDYIGNKELSAKSEP